MTKPSRDHHYVSQFYLRGFTDTGGEDGRLYVHSAERDKPFGPVKTSKVCFQVDYQRIDLPGVSPDAFDKAMASTVESDAAVVLREILQKKVLPANRTKLLKLMTFVALLACQNPSVRAAFARGAGRVQQQRLKLLARHAPERVEEEIAALKARGYVFSEELTSARLLAADFEEYSIRLSQQQHMEQLLISLKAFPMQTLMNRDWTLLAARHDAEDFICSDDPVCLVMERTKGMPTSFLDSPGFATADQILVPLSSRVAMIGSMNPRVRPYEHWKTEQVAHVNALVLNRAQRFLFSAKKDFVWKRPDGSIAQAADLHEPVSV